MSGPRDTVRIQTPDNVAISYPTAGVGSRLVAQMLDTLVAAAIALVAVIIYAGVTGPIRDQRVSTLVAAGAIGVAFFVYVGYFTISELASAGSTLGKSSMGLRVMRVGGGTPRPSETVVRNVLRIVDVGFVGMGLLVMFFHPTSRRLGDLAAGTVVVRSRSAVNLASASQVTPVFLRTPDAGPLIDGVSRLGEHEYFILRAFLSRPGISADQRQALACGMARKLYDRLGLPTEAPERGWPAELFLERLYLQMSQLHRSPAHVSRVPMSRV